MRGLTLVPADALKRAAEHDVLDPWDDSVYTWLMNTQLLNQARELSVEERIELVEAIWDSIAASNAAPPLTEAQKVE